MILRFLFWVLAVLGILFFWRRLQKQSISRSGPRRGGSSQRRMVRDRVCQTFLPEADALRLSRGGVTHFFCSDDCRSRFLAENASPAD